MRAEGRTLAKFMCGEMVGCLYMSVGERHCVATVNTAAAMKACCCASSAVLCCAGRPLLQCDVSVRGSVSVGYCGMYCVQ